MKIGSLFAGIGGFDLAASRVWGWDCVRWQVEIDPWARRVLAKHWPDVARYEDIREVRGADLEPVDLICGGFPCQPFSVAGRQQGREDDRYLWPEMARLVAEVRPAWVVGENVPGLLRLGLDEVCADLEALGYTVWPVGIPAVAVGAPHVRERLWIVGYSGSQLVREGASEPGMLGTPPAEARSRGESAFCGSTTRPSGNASGTHSDGPVADSDRDRCGNWTHQPQRQPECYRPAHVGLAGKGTAPYSHSQRCEEQHASRVAGDAGRATRDAPALGAFWAVEPPVGRVVDGLPGRVDRLRGLGNAIVPQVAELIFRWIAEAEAAA